MIVGKKKYLERIKSNQLTRALRVDKLTLAALESTLRLYLDEEKALKEIPILRMLTVSNEILKARAETLAAELTKKLGPEWQIGISRERARVGGGSLPLAALPSYQVTLECAGASTAELVKIMRKAKRPVIARVRKKKILLDMRSLQEEDDGLLIKILTEILSQGGAAKTGGTDEL